MMDQKTMLMISHRLQSTAVCDTILFMKSGEIAEQGRHEALMEQNGAYARMFALQANWYQEKEV
jgi:ATP-binding cassette subfamily B protein